MVFLFGKTENKFKFSKRNGIFFLKNRDRENLLKFEKKIEKLFQENCNIFGKDKNKKLRFFLDILHIFI